jgi:hypothetical protein
LYAAALRRPPFAWLGTIRRWRSLKQPEAGIGQIAFRVPLVAPGRYVFGLYCASCTPGPRGSLIIDPRLTLVVRRS